MLTICFYYALKMCYYALKFVTYAQGIFLGSLQSIYVKCAQCCRLMYCSVNKASINSLLKSVEVHGACYIILVTCF